MKPMKTSIEQTADAHHVRPSADRRIGPAPAIALLLVLASFAHLHAASGTWTGAGSDGNWSNPDNWTTVPGASFGSTNLEAAMFNAAATPNLPVVIDAGRNLGSILFESSVGQFVIGSTGGNALILSSGGSTAIQSTMAGSNITETIDAPLTLAPSGTTASGSYTFSNNSSNAANRMVFGGPISAGITTQAVTLTLAGVNSGTNNITGSLSDGGATGGLRVVKNGTGAWNLSGSNTFSGGTTLTAGRLNINNAHGLGSGALIVNGGTLGNSSGSAVTLATNNAITLGSSFFVGSGANLNLGTGAVTVTSGNKYIDVASGVVLTLGGAVSGSGAIIRQGGTGALTLSGSNSGFTGELRLVAGTLNLGHSHAAGTGSFNIAGNSSILDNTSGGNLTLATNNAITISSNFIFVGSNSLNLGTGNVNLSGAGNRYFTVNANTLAFGGTVSGAGTIIKQGAGALALLRNNDFNGGVVGNNGGLHLGHAGALGTGTFVINQLGGPTFQMDNVSGAALTLSTNNAITLSTGFTFAGSNDLNLGSGTVSMSGSGTRAITVNASKLTFSGTVTGAGAISKAGTGSLEFLGNNDYSGVTTVTAGTLIVSGTHSGAGAYSVNSNGMLRGDGMIATSANANVTLASGARLAPGTDLEIGTLTMDLGSGSLNISAAVGGLSSQALAFRLDNVQGDKIVLGNASSILAIGTGVLEFGDFAFTLEGAFDAGTYVFTLFDTGHVISGSLGANLNGLIAGNEASISLGDGQRDIILTMVVVPEPAAAAMALFGLSALILFRRRRASGTARS